MQPAHLGCRMRVAQISDFCWKTWSQTWSHDALFSQVTYSSRISGNQNVLSHRRFAGTQEPTCIPWTYELATCELLRLFEVIWGIKKMRSLVSQVHILQLWGNGLKVSHDVSCLKQWPIHDSWNGTWRCQGQIRIELCQTHVAKELRRPKSIALAASPISMLSPFLQFMLAHFSEKWEHCRNNTPCKCKSNCDMERPLRLLEKMTYICWLRSSL